MRGHQCAPTPRADPGRWHRAVRDPGMLDCPSRFGPIPGLRPIHSAIRPGALRRVLRHLPSWSCQTNWPQAGRRHTQSNGRVHPLGPASGLRHASPRTDRLHTYLIWRALDRPQQRDRCPLRRLGRSCWLHRGSTRPRCERSGPPVPTEMNNRSSRTSRSSTRGPSKRTVFSSS